MRTTFFLLFFIMHAMEILSQGVDVEESWAPQLSIESAPETINADLSQDEWREQPLNLNRSTFEELQASGLLSPQQAQAICLHRIRFGPLLDVRELQAIDGFDTDWIKTMLPYLTVGEGKSLPIGGLKRLIGEGKHQLTTRMQFVPEEKYGYDTRYSRPAYEGSPLGLYVRYRFESMGRLRWGLTAEKDPGEALFRESRKSGFDFYSFHLFAKDIGKIRALAVGDYRLSYGQGLVLSGGRNLSTDPCLILTNGAGIRPYTSSTESGFFRGGAVSFNWSRKWNSDIFFSKVMRDANVYNDGDSLTVFTSFQTSGLHRTWYEIQDRRRVSEEMFGVASQFNGRKLRLGSVIYRNRYGQPYQKLFENYNRFDFRGSSFTMGGLHFNWLQGNLNLFGEFAVDGRLKKGFMGGAVWTISQNAGLSVSLREYPIGFHNPHGDGSGMSSRNNAERGFMVGASVRPSRKWTIMASLDRSRFTWLRYGISTPSSALRAMVQFAYKPNKRHELMFRLKKSLGFEDVSDAEEEWTVTFGKSDLSYRAQLISVVSKSFTLRTRIEQKRFQNKDGEANGYLVYQDLLFHPFTSRFSANMRYAWFDTDGYDSRVYAYENDVLYGYSIPSFYYRGTRAYLNLQYKLFNQTTLWLKYSVSWYANRETIGSGYEEISGNRKSEVKIQLRVEF